MTTTLAVFSMNKLIPVVLAAAWPALAIAAPAISPQLATHAAHRNAGLPALALDFTRATVVAAPAAGPEAKAIAVLIEEAEARTLVRWPVVSQPPPASEPAIVVGTFAQVRPLLAARGIKVALNESAVAAEGYQLATVAGPAPTLVIAGKDARGVLFGIGHALRKLHFGPARAGLMAPLDVATSPKYPIRGHQLGYRPKPNSYSGWTAAQWDRYIRELALFGTNAIELIPPRSDDAADSLHFPEPQLDMMRKMSQSCADYGLDVWVWYPALDDDYSKPATVQAALDEWAVVFRALPRIDAILVPGGDPGHTPPELMFPLLEQQTASLRRFHPQATMWLSPQGFTPAQMNYTFNFLAEKQPAWFAGTVFAPWVNMDLAVFRARTPARYRVRWYPDITHIRGAQYPVHDLDFAHALTTGREPVCPRPQDMAKLVRMLAPHTDGAVTYSEGCTDDANKVLWSQLLWDPDLTTEEILRDYGRLFLGERLGPAFGDALHALEQNWRGPIVTHTGIDTTLAQLQALEAAATPRDLLNWRFQMALYRGYYDAYIRHRAVYEQGLEAEATQALRSAPGAGSLAAVARAEAILARADSAASALALRTRTFQLAEALYQTVQMKLSVPLYRAIGQGRGANLDAIDWPLSNAPWLARRFAALRELKDEPARLAALDEIVNWTNPGPGGFYDDLGKPHLQPHLLRGKGYDADPNFIHTVMTTHSTGNPAQTGLRTSWLDHAGTVSETPVVLRYTGLDPRAAYELVFMPVDSDNRVPVRVTADEKHELYRTSTAAVARSRGRTEAAALPEKITLPIPAEATADGTLTVTWAREPGRGGSGRGMVSEVWLRQKLPAPVETYPSHRR